MVGRQRTSFDPETLLLLRQTLEDAWERLTPVKRAMTSRTLLGERILKSAAKGERNRERLRDEAYDVICRLADQLQSSDLDHWVRIGGP